MAESSSEDEFYDCIDDIEVKYFALAYPKERGKGAVFTDMKDASKKLRDVKGSRLKIFSDFKDARRFAALQAEELYSPKTKEKPKLRRDVDPFPNVSQRDLNLLRVNIEKGDKETVRMMIWNNPRHLITESDSPTILQIRFRYNALHVAASRGCSDITTYLLSQMDDPGFWRSLHPTADEETNAERRDRIVDMYLNSPETGNMETPLHFACKFGHTECVRALLAHRLTNRSPVNKENLTPDQVVCSRYSPGGMSGPSVLVKSQEILLALNERYVVLVDNDSERNRGLSARVVEPMTWAELTQRLADFSATDSPVHNSSLTAQNASATITSFSQRGDIEGAPLRPSERVRAYAGPLSPAEANKFYHEWETPPRVKRDEFARLKLIDEEKGFERMGRYLSRQYKTSWKEYWAFIDDFSDLSTHEGLQQLESHLQKQITEDPPALQLSQPEFVELMSELELNNPWQYRNPTGSPDSSNSSGGGPFSLLSYTPPAEQRSNVMNTSGSLDEIPATGAAPSSNSSTGSTGFLSSLTRMFANLALVSPPQSNPAPATPERGDNHQTSGNIGTRFSRPDPPVFQSTPLPPNRRKLPRRALRTSLSGAGRLNQTDFHASRALNCIDASSLEQFPRVKAWRAQVSSLDTSNSSIAMNIFNSTH